MHHTRIKYDGLSGYDVANAYTLNHKRLVEGAKDINNPKRTRSRNMKTIQDKLFNEGLDTRDSKNRVVTHTLRHTFASHLAINSVPIFTIKELMNHANIEMTMRYAKLAPDSGKSAVQGLYR